MRAIIVAAFLIAFATVASAQDYPGQPFSLTNSAPPLPAALITGTCATTNAIAYFSAAQVIACRSTFKFDGTTLTLDAPTIALLQDTNFALSGGINGLSIDGTTFSVDATNDRIGIGTTSPGKDLDITSTHAATDTAVRVVNASPTGWSSALVSGTNGGLMGMTAFGGSASGGAMWSGELTPIYNGAAILNGDANITSLSLMTGANTASLYLGTNNTVGVVVDASTQDMIQLKRYVTQGSAPTDGGGSCTGETIAGNSTTTSGHVSATCTVGQTIILTLVDTFANAPNCYLTCTDADCVTDAFYVSGQATNQLTLTASVGSAVAADLNYFCVESR